jgi:hypothetical protein
MSFRAGLEKTAVSSEFLKKRIASGIVSRTTRSLKSDAPIISHVIHGFKQAYRGNRYRGLSESLSNRVIDAYGKGDKASALSAVRTLKNLFPKER